MDVIIVGEDAVTQAIVKRLIKEICPDGIRIDRIDPARGGQIRSKVVNYNRLAAKERIVLLADLDQANCPVEEQQRWLNQVPKHPHFLFRFAIDEAESWLLADRNGLARFLQVNPELIPNPTAQNAREPHEIEVRTPYKSSLFLMWQLAANSADANLRVKLTPKSRGSKGPEYNTTLVPFIENLWDVRAALENSSSLRRMYDRLAQWCIESQLLEEE